MHVIKRWLYATALISDIYLFVSLFVCLLPETQTCMFGPKGAIQIRYYYYYYYYYYLSGIGLSGPAAQ